MTYVANVNNTCTNHKHKTSKLYVDQKLLEDTLLMVVNQKCNLGYIEIQLFF